ncbi:MAG: selenocysteine-specific translation elongation factor [Deltaproteobacteria bacterium]|nr:selenocysteine-specific translation elongation factor [Deltaproteobacteria bacterium]
MTADAAHPLVVGTAGHIDHGKTALVYALTGVDTDRLAVEKQRGITTELGFAPLVLDGRTIAIVDVPGHERFIKSMVAGAVGVDLVVMVIAADEGVMPQTREHLDICHLLGVRRGVIALTKSDLVDDDWRALVEDEIRTAVADSFLASAPIVPVSAKTGAGLDALRATLAAELAQLPPRPTVGALRLPLDRVFTMRGFGTVVTGTIASGAVAIGDELVVIPSGATGRVRGLQIHGQPVLRAVAGMRCAVNLGGLAVEDLARGDTLVRPGELEPSHILDVRVRLVPTARPIDRRARVLLHHGTAQRLAQLSLVDREQLGPGEEALAQLRLDATEALAAAPGDRFIIRGTVTLANHGTTLGGGEIVRVLAARARRGSEHAEVVARLATARLPERVAEEVRTTAAAGLDLPAIGHRVGRTPAELTAVLDALIERGELVRVGDERGVYLHAAVLASLSATLRGLVDPTAGVAREEARSRLPQALPRAAFDALVDELVRAGAVVATADRLTRAAPRVVINPADAALVERFRAWALEPPRPKEIPAATGMAEPAARAALERLLAARTITKVKPDYYVGTEALDALRARLIAHLDTRGEITPQEWKDVCGTSRKFSIPLAEFFDGEKLTLRVGEIRRRRK